MNNTESSSSRIEREMVVSNYRVTTAHIPMENSTTKTLLTIMIVIGIIIIILLLSPRYGFNRGTYSYSGNSMLTASTASFDTRSSRSTSRDPGHYTIIRTYPQSMPSTTYTYTSYPSTYYQYPVTQQYVDDGGIIFPDGCTLTSPTSTTTGLPCS